MAVSAPTASSMEAGNIFASGSAAAAPGDTAPVERPKILTVATRNSLKRKLQEVQEKKKRDEQKSKSAKKENEPVIPLDISSDSEDSSDTRSITPSPAKEEPYKDPPKAVEVFNGLGVLGSELKKQGFAVIGIDFKGCKDKPLVKTMWIDLSTRAGQLEFWDIIREGNISYVHFAPPCGTASAARNIRRRFILSL